MKVEVLVPYFLALMSFYTHELIDPKQIIFLLITSSQTTSQVKSSQEVMLKFLIMGPQDFVGPNSKV
jgi:hypothetical protein